MSERKIPLPKILEAMEAKKDISSKSGSNRRQSSMIRINECGICHQTKDQHQLALCDSCQLYYHLYCLDPPLTRMPKKSRFGGWQCSECTEQQETQDSDNEASNHSGVGGTRKLREHVKGPNKFEPDAGYSPPSSVASLTKTKKRKSNWGPFNKKKKRLSEKSGAEGSDASEPRRKRGRKPNHEKEMSEQEICFQCNQTAVFKERVRSVIFARTSIRWVNSLLTDATIATISTILVVWILR